jgi:hypothetical protein
VVWLPLVPGGEPARVCSAGAGAGVRAASSVRHHHTGEAGDIASCESDGDGQTAKLLDRIPGTVFTLGDKRVPTGPPRTSPQQAMS